MPFVYTYIHSPFYLAKKLNQIYICSICEVRYSSKYPNIIKLDTLTVQYSGNIHSKLGSLYRHVGIKTLIRCLFCWSIKIEPISKQTQKKLGQKLFLIQRYSILNVRNFLILFVTYSY